MSLCDFVLSVVVRETQVSDWVLSAQHALSASSRDFKFSKQLPHAKWNLPAKRFQSAERA